MLAAMLRSLGGIFFGVTVVAAQQGTAPVPFDLGAAWQRVAARFEQECAQHEIVGASLLFVRGEEEVGFIAHGDADRAGHRAVDRDTIYHWASCTKTLTGIAAMQLRDRGKLALDQPIVDLVPELRAVHDAFGDVSAITVRHLLAHSAGFRGATWPWGGDRPWHPHEPTQWAQLVAMMPYTEVEFAPGTKFAYSNPGIVFVGRAIERLSGEDYEVYVDKNLLRPLGMTHSYFDVTPYHLQRYRSHSYAIADGGVVTDHGADFDTGITVSNGGLNAPLPDMARYLAFLLGACAAGSDAANVLARTSIAEMWQPGLPTGHDEQEHIGLAFFVQQHGGQTFVTHTGGQRDFVSFFYVHPQSGTGAVGAFNTSSAGPVMHALRRRCMEELSLPLATATPPAPVESSSRWQVALADGPPGRRIVLTVPSGGYQLEQTSAARHGADLDVELKLTTPANDETTTQALEDLAIELPAESLDGAARVLVHIATWQRGAAYFVAPKAELVATLPLH